MKAKGALGSSATARRAKPVSIADRKAGREESAWREQHRALVVFHRERGHCDVPVQSRKHRGLAAWLTTQREREAQGHLAAARKLALEELGVDFTPDADGPKRDPLREFREQAWEKRFADLEEFHRRFGHTRVSRGWQEIPGLDGWRHHQRELYRQGKMDPGRKARLDELGFEWEEPDRYVQSRIPQWEQVWEQHFRDLEEFHRRFGHCLVLTGWEENPGLAIWVHKLRREYRRGWMRPDRLQRLKALGFAWESDYAHFRNAWDRRYHELTGFHSRFGHLRVSRQWKENPGLASWLDHQREHLRSGKLTPERREKLDALGFSREESLPRAARRLPAGRSPLNARQEMAWEQRIGELLEYRERFGDCLVPIRWKENPSLAHWVFGVRQLHRYGRLREDRREQLDALGFVWRPMQARSGAKWEQRFRELETFHRRYSDTRVTGAYAEQPDLWRFRAYQRQLFRQGQLDPERKARLDALGFDWDDDFSRACRRWRAGDGLGT